MNAYIIVKHAGTNWSFYFAQDPKKGAPLLYVVRDSWSKHIKVKPYYLSLEEAEKDCAKLKELNTFGDYAVCPLLHGELL